LLGDNETDPHFIMSVSAEASSVVV
jgi:hypothetical protein